eukprot:1297526-Amphidinium_carterae.1
MLTSLFLKLSPYLTAFPLFGQPLALLARRKLPTPGSCCLSVPCHLHVRACVRASVPPRTEPCCDFARVCRSRFLWAAKAVQNRCKGPRIAPLHALVGQWGGADQQILKCQPGVVKDRLSIMPFLGFGMLQLDVTTWGSCEWLDQRWLINAGRTRAHFLMLWTIRPKCQL